MLPVTVAYKQIVFATPPNELASVESTGLVRLQQVDVLQYCAIPIDYYEHRPYTATSSCTEANTATLLVYTVLWVGDMALGAYR